MVKEGMKLLGPDILPPGTITAAILFAVIAFYSIGTTLEQYPRVERP
jgi:hypothetical protein